MQWLSAVDAFFLTVESPETPMHVGGLAILNVDGKDPDWIFFSLRARLGNRLKWAPFLRQKLAKSPPRLASPSWVEDRDFSLARHIVPLCLLAPADQRGLGRLTASLIQNPLTRDHPLWMLYYVEHLGHSQAACIMIIHHAYLDGVSVAHLLEVLLNDDCGVIHKRAMGEGIVDGSSRYPHACSTQAVAVRRVRFPALVKRTAVAAMTSGMTAFSSRGVTHFHGMLRRTPLVPPRTRFNSVIDSRRSYGFCSLPTGEVKLCRTALGATVNDLILNVCAGALREYLLSKGELPERPLIAGIPFSIRRRGAKLPLRGNFVVMFRVPLDLRIDDPLVRQRVIGNSVNRLKNRYRLIPDELWESWTRLAFSTVTNSVAGIYKMAVEYFGAPFNLVISSVPGSTARLSLNGVPLVAAYPISAPYHGLALNITAFSYHDQINIGITSWEGAVPDAQDFAVLVKRSFEALLVGVKEATSFGRKGVSSNGSSSL